MPTVFPPRGGRRTAKRSDGGDAKRGGRRDSKARPTGPGSRRSSRSSSPSSGPAGHLPPRGGKAVMMAAPNSETVSFFPTDRRNPETPRRGPAIIPSSGSFLGNSHARRTDLSARTRRMSPSRAQTHDQARMVRASRVRGRASPNPPRMKSSSTIEPNINTTKTPLTPTSYVQKAIPRRGRTDPSGPNLGAGRRDRHWTERGGDVEGRVGAVPGSSIPGPSPSKPGAFGVASGP